MWVSNLGHFPGICICFYVYAVYLEVPFNGIYKVCVTVQRLTINVDLGLLFTVSADQVAKFRELLFSYPFFCFFFFVFLFFQLYFVIVSVDFYVPVIQFKWFLLRMRIYYPGLLGVFSAILKLNFGIFVIHLGGSFFFNLKKRVTNLITFVY